MSKPPNLVQGTLDLLILKILDLEPRSGWAIGQRLKQVSSDALQVSNGSLYLALHKLEQQGWITAEWRTTENNRRAKIYALTPPGRRYLDAGVGDRRDGHLLRRRRRAPPAARLPRAGTPRHALADRSGRRQPSRGGFSGGFSGLAGSDPQLRANSGGRALSLDFTGAGEPEMFFGSLVTEGFFDLLSANAVLGRTFLPEEHRPGSGVAVLTHGSWQRRFGGETDIIGPLTGAGRRTVHRDRRLDPRATGGGTSSDGSVRT